MAELVIKKWGNSLAARIPKAIANMIGLEINQTVRIEAENGKIIITPVREKKEYTIEQLLDQCDPKAIELDDDDKNWLNAEPVGKEWQW